MVVLIDLLVSIIIHPIRDKINTYQLQEIQMKLEFHDLAAVTDNTTNIMIGGELLTVNSSHKTLRSYTRETPLVLKSAILYET